MSFFRFGCGLVSCGLLLLFVGGCDIPTEGPSIQSETSIDAPLVAEKTVSFLGGPESRYDPLVDTTTSTFDSLFTVGAPSGDISVVQTVDDFEIGTLEEALAEAGAGDVFIDRTFRRPLIEDSELARQDLDASYVQTNAPYETSDPATTGPVRVASFDDNEGDEEVVIAFPGPGLRADAVFERPDFGAVDAQGTAATVDSVQLTETAVSPETGRRINRIAVTLINRGGGPLRGQGGTGAPTIQLRDGGNGPVVQSVTFDAPIAASERATAVLDVQGRVLDEALQYRLLVSGTDDRDELALDLSAWRYQKAHLSNASNVEIGGSQDPVTAIGPRASQFVAIEIQEGTDTLAIDNRFAFPLSLDEVTVQNNEPSFGSVPPLDIAQPFSSTVPSGAEAVARIDMGGRGISESVDVDVSTSPATSQITVTADGALGISNQGTLAVQTMYFRPEGEAVQTSGTVAFGGDDEEVDFERGDFVEVSSALVDVNNLALQRGAQDNPRPQVTFDTLRLSYPDLRTPPYTPADSLEIRFVSRPDGPFERERIDTREPPRNLEIALDDQKIRIFPGEPGADSIRYTVKGRLVSNPFAEAVLSVDDQITANTTVDDDEFTLERLEVSEASPFSVEVTPDADGDGTIELSNSDEVRTASFEGFSGLTDQVDGIQLANVGLDFSVETQNLVLPGSPGRPDVELFAAIQGRDGDQRLFLEGQGPTRGVTTLPSALKPFGGVQTGELIRFGVDLSGARLGETTQQTLPVTDANSNVSAFVNALPASVRLAGQATLNEDGGPVSLQRPVTLDAGFTVDVPLQVKGEFVVRDTLDVDLSDLRDLTDPSEDLTISAASLTLGYENGLPLGADVQLRFLDEAGTPVRTFTDDALRLQPAPKDAEGAARRMTERQTVTLTLGTSRSALRTLADGTEVALRLRMRQAPGPPARLRADDRLRLDLNVDVEASVRAGK